MAQNYFHYETSNSNRNSEGTAQYNAQLRSSLRKQQEELQLQMQHTMMRASEGYQTHRPHHHHQHQHYDHYNQQEGDTSARTSGNNSGVLLHSFDASHRVGNPKDLTEYHRVSANSGYTNAPAAALGGDRSISIPLGMIDENGFVVPHPVQHAEMTKEYIATQQALLLADGASPVVFSSARSSRRELYGGRGITEEDDGEVEEQQQQQFMRVTAADQLISYTSTGAMPRGSYSNPDISAQITRNTNDNSYQQHKHHHHVSDLIPRNTHHLVPASSANANSDASAPADYYFAASSSRRSSFGFGMGSSGPNSSRTTAVYPSVTATDAPHHNAHVRHPNDDHLRQQQRQSTHHGGIEGVGVGDVLDSGSDDYRGTVRAYYRDINGEAGEKKNDGQVKAKVSKRFVDDYTDDDHVNGIVKREPTPYRFRNTEEQREEDADLRSTRLTAVGANNNNDSNADHGTNRVSGSDGTMWVPATGGANGRSATTVLRKEQQDWIAQQQQRRITAQNSHQHINQNSNQTTQQRNHYGASVSPAPTPVFVNSHAQPRSGLAATPAMEVLAVAPKSARRERHETREQLNALAAISKELSESPSPVPMVPHTTIINASEEETPRGKPLKDTFPSHFHRHAAPTMAKPTKMAMVPPRIKPRSVGSVSLSQNGHADGSLRRERVGESVRDGRRVDRREQAFGAGPASPSPQPKRPLLSASSTAAVTDGQRKERGGSEPFVSGRPDPEYFAHVHRQRKLEEEAAERKRKEFEEEAKRIEEEGLKARTGGRFPKPGDNASSSNTDGHAVQRANADQPEELTAEEVIKASQKKQYEDLRWMLPFTSHPVSPTATATATQKKDAKEVIRKTIDHEEEEEKRRKIAAVMERSTVLPSVAAKNSSSANGSLLSAEMIEKKHVNATVSHFKDTAKEAGGRNHANQNEIGMSENDALLSPAARPRVARKSFVLDAFKDSGCSPIITTSVVLGKQSNLQEEGQRVLKSDDGAVEEEAERTAKASSVAAALMASLGVSPIIGQMTPYDRQQKGGGDDFPEDDEGFEKEERTLEKMEKPQSGAFSAPPPPPLPFARPVETSFVLTTNTVHTDAADDEDYRDEARSVSGQQQSVSQPRRLDDATDEITPVPTPTPAPRTFTDHGGGEGVEDDNAASLPAPSCCSPQPTQPATGDVNDHNAADECDDGGKGRATAVMREDGSISMALDSPTQTENARSLSTSNSNGIPQKQVAFGSHGRSGCGNASRSPSHQRTDNTSTKQKKKPLVLLMGKESIRRAACSAEGSLPPRSVLSSSPRIPLSRPVANSRSPSPTAGGAVRGLSAQGSKMRPLSRSVRAGKVPISTSPIPQLPSSQEIQKREDIDEFQSNKSGAVSRPQSDATAVAVDIEDPSNSHSFSPSPAVPTGSDTANEEVTVAQLARGDPTTGASLSPFARAGALAQPSPAAVVDVSRQHPLNSSPAASNAEALEPLERKNEQESDDHQHDNHSNFFSPTSAQLTSNKMLSSDNAVDTSILSSAVPSSATRHSLALQEMETRLSNVTERLSLLLANSSAVKPTTIISRDHLRDPSPSHHNNASPTDDGTAAESGALPPHQRPTEAPASSCDGMQHPNPTNHLMMTPRSRACVALSDTAQRVSGALAATRQILTHVSAAAALFTGEDDSPSSSQQQHEQAHQLEEEERTDDKKDKEGQVSIAGADKNSGHSPDPDAALLESAEAEYRALRESQRVGLGFSHTSHHHRHVSLPPTSSISTNTTTTVTNTAARLPLSSQHFVTSEKEEEPPYREGDANHRTLPEPNPEADDEIWDDGARDVCVNTSITAPPAPSHSAADVMMSFGGGSSYFHQIRDAADPFFDDNSGAHQQSSFYTTMDSTQQTNSLGARIAESDDDDGGNDDDGGDDDEQLINIDQYDAASLAEGRPSQGHPHDGVLGNGNNEDYDDEENNRLTSAFFATDDDGFDSVAPPPPAPGRHTESPSSVMKRRANSFRRDGGVGTSSQTSSSSPSSSSVRRVAPPAVLPRGSAVEQQLTYSPGANDLLENGDRRVTRDQKEDESSVVMHSVVPPPTAAAATSTTANDVDVALRSHGSAWDGDDDADDSTDYSSSSVGSSATAQSLNLQLAVSSSAAVLDTILNTLTSIESEMLQGKRNKTLIDVSQTAEDDAAGGGQADKASGNGKDSKSDEEKINIDLKTDQELVSAATDSSLMSASAANNILVGVGGAFNQDGLTLTDESFNDLLRRAGEEEDEEEKDPRDNMGSRGGEGSSNRAVCEAVAALNEAANARGTVAPSDSVVVSMKLVSTADESENDEANTCSSLKTVRASANNSNISRAVRYDLNGRRIVPGNPSSLNASRRSSVSRAANTTATATGTSSIRAGGIQPPLIVSKNSGADLITSSNENAKSNTNTGNPSNTSRLVMVTSKAVLRSAPASRRASPVPTPAAPTSAVVGRQRLTAEAIATATAAMAPPAAHEDLLDDTFNVNLSSYSRPPSVASSSSRAMLGGERASISVSSAMSTTTANARAISRRGSTTTASAFGRTVPTQPSSVRVAVATNTGSRMSQRPSVAEMGTVASLLLESANANREGVASRRSVSVASVCSSSAAAPSRRNSVASSTRMSSLMAPTASSLGKTKNSATVGGLATATSISRPTSRASSVTLFNTLGSAEPVTTTSTRLASKGTRGVVTKPSSVTTARVSAVNGKAAAAAGEMKKEATAPAASSKMTSRAPSVSAVGTCIPPNQGTNGKEELIAANMAPRDVSPAAVDPNSFADAGRPSVFELPLSRTLTDNSILQGKAAGRDDELVQTLEGRDEQQEGQSPAPAHPEQNVVGAKRLRSNGQCEERGEVDRQRGARVERELSAGMLLLNAGNVAEGTETGRRTTGRKTDIVVVTESLGACSMPVSPQRLCPRASAKEEALAHAAAPHDTPLIPLLPESPAREDCSAKSNGRSPARLIAIAASGATPQKSSRKAENNAAIAIAHQPPQQRNSFELPNYARATVSSIARVTGGVSHHAQLPFSSSPSLSVANHKGIGSKRPHREGEEAAENNDSNSFAASRTPLRCRVGARTSRVVSPTLSKTPTQIGELGRRGTISMSPGRIDPQINRSRSKPPPVRGLSPRQYLKVCEDRMSKEEAFAQRQTALRELFATSRGAIAESLAAHYNQSSTLNTSTPRKTSAALPSPRNNTVSQPKTKRLLPFNLVLRTMRRHMMASASESQRLLRLNAFEKLSTLAEDLHALLVVAESRRPHAAEDRRALQMDMDKENGPSAFGMADPLSQDTSRGGGKSKSVNPADPNAFSSQPSMLDHLFPCELLSSVAGVHVLASAAAVPSSSISHIASSSTSSPSVDECNAMIPYEELLDRLGSCSLF